MEHLDYFFPDISTRRSREVLLEDPTPYYKRWGEIMLSHIHPELKSPLDIFEYIRSTSSKQRKNCGTIRGKSTTRGSSARIVASYFHHAEDEIVMLCQSTNSILKLTTATATTIHSSQRTRLCSSPGSAAVSSPGSAAVSALQKWDRLCNSPRRTMASSAASGSGAATAPCSGRGAAASGRGGGLCSWLGE